MLLLCLSRFLYDPPTKIPCLFPKGTRSIFFVEKPSLWIVRSGSAFGLLATLTAGRFQGSPVGKQSKTQQINTCFHQCLHEIYSLKVTEGFNTTRVLKIINFIDLAVGTGRLTFAGALKPQHAWSLAFRIPLI